MLIDSSMECNKDEANRAKSLAESKLVQKDFLGAKKFALKAQTLYPGLDGISQLLITLDVHLSAENKIRGEVDWYRVVGVNPSADCDTIKKQYRKLALMLHPDKNKFVGADNAFKLVSEAWRLLSDKEKRDAYNQRRGYKGLQQNVPTHTGDPSTTPCRQPQPSQQKVPPASAQQSKKKVTSAPSGKKVPVHTGGSSAPPRPYQPSVSTHMGDSSTPSMANGFFNHASSTTSTPKSHNGSEKMSKTKNYVHPHHRTDTFWTICRGCNIHFEYLKIYRNHTLICRSCEKPFMASEIPPPENFSKSAKRVPWCQREGLFNKILSQNAYAQKPGAGLTSPDSCKYMNYQQGSFPETATTHSEKPGNVVRQAHDNLKRLHTESHASADLSGCFKRGKLDDSNRCGASQYMARGSSDFGTRSTFGSGLYGFSGSCNQPSSTSELTPLETRNVLVQKGQKEIEGKLSDSRL